MRTCVRVSFTLLVLGNIIIYCCGATWAVVTPEQGEYILVFDTIGATGTGLGNVTCVAKVQTLQGSAIAEKSTTVGGPADGTDEGEWEATLVPPPAAPFNHNWPEGLHQVAIYRSGDEKDKNTVTFAQMP